jgi:hypothetical protein
MAACSTDNSQKWGSVQDTFELKVKRLTKRLVHFAKKLEAVVSNKYKEDRNMYFKSCIFLEQRRCFLTIVIVVLIAALNALTVAAEERKAASGWEFSVAPYLWAISMDGSVTVRGFEADVDASFNDILDELNFAFMLAYEARKGHWGLWGNTIYSNLGNSDVDGPAGFAEVDPTVTAFWQELGGFYRLGTWDLADSSDKKTPSVTVDTFFGARYTYLDAKIDFKLEGPFRSSENNVDEDKSWLEPLLGIRTIWDLNERWVLTMAGDIGGVTFGSDFAWSASGLIGYQFSLFGEDNARVFAGYRALYQDYTDGSGNDKFEWDVTLHGPILGLGIRF